MEAQPTNKRRFSEVVGACGQPEAVSLWTDPRENKAFMAVVHQNRVLTIKQVTLGNKKDFGVIGFLEERNVLYLVFPKALSTFKNSRIIGIKYDLIKTSHPVG